MTFISNLRAVPHKNVPPFGGSYWAHYECNDASGSAPHTILDSSGNARHATLANGSVTQMSPGLRVDFPSLRIPVSGLSLPFHVVIEYDVFETNTTTRELLSNKGGGADSYSVNPPQMAARVEATGSGGVQITRTGNEVGPMYLAVATFRSVADLPAHSAELYISEDGGAYIHVGYDDALSDNWWTTGVQVTDGGVLNLGGQWNGTYWLRATYYDIKVIEGDWTP